MISEITAICEYLDEVSTGNSLIGDNAEEKAETRMWIRRLDLGVCDPMTSGFRAIEGRPLFESRMKIYSPEAGVELKAIAQDKLAWLDAQLGGNEFICGKRFSLADIFLFCFLEFGTSVGQAINTDHKNINKNIEKLQKEYNGLLVKCIVVFAFVFVINAFKDNLIFGCINHFY